MGTSQPERYLASCEALYLLRKAGPRVRGGSLPFAARVTISRPPMYMGVCVLYVQVFFVRERETSTHAEDKVDDRGDEGLQVNCSPSTPLLLLSVSTFLITLN